MKRLRLTIAQIILVVLVAAIGLGAIRSGSAAWAGAMSSIAWFAMISSLLGIGLGRGLRRVFWSGFATLGWSYLLLIYVPWLYEKVGQFLLAPNLFPYLEEALEALRAGSQAVTGGQGTTGLQQSLPLEILGASATGGGFGGGSGVDGLSDFVRIGVAIEALLWAYLGGWAACYFASGRDRASDTQIAGPAGSPNAEKERHGDESMRRNVGPSA